MANSKRDRQLTREQVEFFTKAQEQLVTFHADVEKLSNKKPDGPLNAFKLRYINQVLEAVNQLLGDEFRPFPDFTLFDLEGALPTASDVVMMLSQYRKSMVNFRSAHQKTITKPNKHFPDHEDKFVVWNLSDGDDDLEGDNQAVQEE
jgi:hypothetical protein